MKEEKARAEQVHNRLLILAAAVMILAASVFTLLFPEDDMLYRENRKASPAPAFSVDSVLDGSYGEALSSYISDKVVLRQFWIDAACFIDQNIFRKTEENGILIGKEDRLFTKDFEGYGDEALLDKNIAEIEKYAAESELPVYVMIVPSAAAVDPEMLPDFAPQRAEKERLAEINNRLSSVCEVVDPYPALRAHNGEYIWYRNDHHWTTLGAYYAYAELAEGLGKEAAVPDWEMAKEAENFLGTHYASSRYRGAQPDTIRYFPSDTLISVKKVLGDAEFEEERQVPLINTEKLEAYDKYAAFLDGNNGYTVIPGTGSGRILVVKDSFANCLVPFMTGDFEQIGVVDYRNYSYGLRNLAEKEDYDEILILYSYATLETDKRLVYMNRP